MGAQYNHHKQESTPVLELELSSFTRITKMATSSSVYDKSVDPTVVHHENGKNYKLKSERTFWEHFQQQSLPAWRPIYSALRLSPALFIIGLVFVPVGATIWVFSDRLKEVSVPYTDCKNILQNEDYQKPCSEVVGDPESALAKECKCLIKFTIPEDMPGTVYIYYSLTNFYQNHRLYVSSRDDSQLRGKTGTAAEPKEPARECSPFDYQEDGYNNGTKRIYLPCGAIANSMFSDRITLYYRNESQGFTRTVQVPLNRTGIAWESDKKYKFNNPPWFENYSTDPELQNVFVKPKFWKWNLWELDPEDPENNGLKNEDLIVWMRAAALPNFRKLFRIVNRFHPDHPGFAEGIPKGDYELEIDYNFPVKQIQGTKTIVFTTKSVLGTAGPFVGVAYVITGIVCVILATFLLIVHVRANMASHKFNGARKIR